jgi:hypothetical protein
MANAFFTANSIIYTTIREFAVEPPDQLGDRSKRVCRFCRSEVETPEHALLGCDASPEVVHLRSSFLVQLIATAPNLRRLMEKPNMTLIEFFKSMVYERSTIPLVAKFAHEVLEVFYANTIVRL